MAQLWILIHFIVFGLLTQLNSFNFKHYLFQLDYAAMIANWQHKKHKEIIKPFYFATGS